MDEVVEFDRPQRFVAGTVGQPGEREFFLQARDDHRLVSVALEKDQVAVLADRIDALLDHVLSIGEGQDSIPVQATGLEDLGPLDVPIETAFRVRMMSLTWDGDRQCVTLEATSEDDEQTLRVHLTGRQARAFCQRASAVVAAGRPPCPFCSQPLDPRGHICPRANGYRRR